MRQWRASWHPVPLHAPTARFMARSAASCANGALHEEAIFPGSAG